MDIDTIGYFLFMEEQEKQALKNRSGEQNPTTREPEPQQTEKTEKKYFYPITQPSYRYYSSLLDSWANSLNL